MSKESIEEKIIKSLTKLYINHINQTETIIRADNISINFWTMERNSLLENEPPKIFKRKHLEWEYKLKDVTEHLEDLFRSREMTIKDFKIKKED